MLCAYTVQRDNIILEILLQILITYSNAHMYVRARAFVTKYVELKLTTWQDSSLLVT